MEKITDGFHTFDELYEFRMLYNAAFVNLMTRYGSYYVYKSKKHSDGSFCFDGNYFVVVIELPTGQISNHYELKNWDLFKCKEKEISDGYDGHTCQNVIDRLRKYNLDFYDLYFNVLL